MGIGNRAGSFVHQFSTLPAGNEPMKKIQVCPATDSVYAARRPSGEMAHSGSGLVAPI
jgi:hypothetical protein